MDKLNELKELMHICVETGYMRAQADMMPNADKIRRKDAEALMVRNGFSKVLLARWVSEGLVTEHKGEKNSPIWYSTIQIMETIGAVRINSVINK